MPDNYEVYYLGTADSPMFVQQWLQSLLDDNLELVCFSEGWWVFRKVYPLVNNSQKMDKRMTYGGNGSHWDGCAEVHWDCKIAQLEAELAALREQVNIATDLGAKRWVALNEIYETGEKHNVNWCKRKAMEGLGVK